MTTLDSEAMSGMGKEIRRLAGRALHQYRMIQNGDRILVGLSGGKDSMVLLAYLDERRKRIPIDYSLVVVHLNLGYESREQTEKLAEFVAQRPVTYHFEDTRFALLGHSETNRENPCFLCARLRRKRLFELARTYRCSKIALGHHRDDLNETLLMNIFYSGEISTMMPSQAFFGGLLTVIRPFCMVPEERIRKAAARMNLPLLESGCPSDSHSKRLEIKEMIERATERNEKVKGNIFRSLSNYRPEYLLGTLGKRGST